MTERPFDPTAYRNWTPAAQEAALAKLNAARNSTWRPFYCPQPACDGKPHQPEGKWSWPHARSDQKPPPGTPGVDWVTWALGSGRGAGKTVTGAHYTHKITEIAPRIALIAPTSADARDVMVDGETGLIATSPPGKRPFFEPSKRRLTWPNGCVATLFSAEQPERLRGPQFHYAWLEEFCTYPLAQEVWDMLMFGLRLYTKDVAPHVLITTTPKPRKVWKDIKSRDSTQLVTVSTYANIDNLAPTFREAILKRYEGTRLGRQELLGETLEDVEGAMWTWDMIEAARVQEAPDHMDRIVVGVDPAGSKRRTADETGIVVVGIADDELYVLADRSGRYTPTGWAGAAMGAYDQFNADAIAVEVNFGGDMVRQVMRSIDATPRIIDVRATRGKSIRMEPVVGRYERGEVHHVGPFPELEEQLTTWLPYEDRHSPDRADALVWACVHLMGRAALAEVASPKHLRLVREA